MAVRLEDREGDYTLKKNRMALKKVVSGDGTVEWINVGNGRWLSAAAAAKVALDAMYAEPHEDIVIVECVLSLTADVKPRLVTR